MELNLKNNSQLNNQIIAKSDENKIENALRVRFLKSREAEIEAFFNKYKDNTFVPFPDDVIYSAAKVRAALSHYLEETDYEFIPNSEDLIDITGEEVTDEDIANEKLVKEDYVSLDDVIDADGTIYDRDTECDLDLMNRDETISDGSYERDEFDDVIYESLYLLHPEEREILSYRFGLYDYDELNVHQISKLFQMSEEEVSEHIDKALAHMKSLMATML